jgi:hypothetical protein
MIDAYSRLIGGLFNVSTNDKVVMGRDSWLFFQETIGDYDGSAALCDEQMDILSRNLLKLKHTAEARGQVFLLAVAPNKNTLYREYMPSRYKRTNAPTNMERLLMTEGLDSIDLTGALLESDKPTYFKSDSHWNGRGSRIAAREIMLAITEKTGVMPGIDIMGNGLYELEEITGDLGRMLYPASHIREADYIYGEARQNYTNIGRVRSLDDMFITTESNGTTLRVAVYRDSFANALIPYFSNAYSNVYYTRQTPPPMDSPAFLEADVIVFQIVERRLGELLSYWE